MKLIGEKEVAEILGVSLQTMRNWRNRKEKLPFHKVGSLVKYNEKDVTDFIEASKINIKEGV